MSAKKRKERREARSDPYDDIDIFSGPAGQVLVDIDPLYGGIQLQEDELPGSRFTRDLARAGKEITDVFTPSEETKAEIEERDRKEQEAFAMLLKATGVEPETFEAGQLEGKLRRDAELRKLLNLPTGFFDRGLTDLRLGFATAGEFLFGEANKGLTTMTEEGTKFKDLPFDQRLGIAILPIDLLDVAGVTALGVRGLQPLLRRGLQKYGKKSGKTINDLLNDEELMRELDELEPGFMKELDDTLGGGIIQKRFMTGRKKGPVGTELRPKTRNELAQERDEIAARIREREGPIRFDDQGRPIFSTAPFSETQGTVDDALERAAKEAEALKRETDKLKADEIRKAAKSVSEVQPLTKKFTVDDFAKDFNRLSQKKSFDVKTTDFVNQLKAKYRDNYSNLFNEAVDKKLIDPKRTRASINIDLQTPVLNELKKLDFKNLDPKKDVIGDIVRRERKKLGLPDYNPGGGKGGSELNVINRLIQSGAIDKKLANNIKKFQDQRQKLGRDAATEAATLARTKKAKKRAKVFRDVIADIQEGKDYDVIFNANQIVPLLKEKNPELFSASYKNASSRAKLINSMIAQDAGLEQYINKTGYIPDPETFRISTDVPIQQNVFAKKFIEEFRPGESYIELLQKDPELRFYNNLRRSSGQNVDDFFATVNLEDIQKGGDKYEDFLKFEKIDKARIEANEALKPILKKIFDALRMDLAVKRGISGEGLDALVFDSISSTQLAHKFKLSGVTEGFAADKIGRGAKAEEIYLDISDYNSYIQNGLEKEARDAYNMFQETQDPKFKARFDAVDQDMKILGIEGQVAPGVKVGEAKPFDQKLSELMINAMDYLYDPVTKKGILTQTEVNKAITAANKIAKAKKDYEMMFGEAATFQRGGLVNDMNIFDDEEEGTIFPKISIEFGDAAQGRAMAQPSLEKRLAEPVQRLSAEPKAAPQEKVFDVPPIENIFTGEVQEANLKLPFFKLFTKPPVNETAPIPTPKESLNNPTKKQKQSLEQEKLNKEEDFFDPTPEDNQKVDLGSSTDVATTPKTNQPLTGVFYSDAEKVLQRPDAPVIFPNKQALIDYFAKNRIKKTELEDYGINNLLKAYDDVTPVPKDAVIRQIRSAPVRGMHVHGTGKGSEIINPSGQQVNVAYEGYREDGFIPGTTSERVLYIPMDKLPGDTAGAPRAIFEGETIQNHGFGLPGGSDNNYVIGWTRLSERRAILPTKIGAPTDRSKIPGLTREKERARRQVAGLYAEAINKLNREGVRRGLNQGDLDLINELSLEQLMSQYGDTLNELSPGLLDQIDELIVKVRGIDDQIAKASAVDASNVVKVQFADEIQSDIMQAAAGRKQKLLATLAKLRDEGRESTTLPELDRIGNAALEFFEQNKSVFRPLKKSQTEVDIFADSLAKVDAEVDEIINRFVETREISDADITRVKTLLNDQIDEMINDLITVDQNTYEGLFPDLPFKKREEWADALIKKDLFELAYRKFVLKDPDVPDYYAVTPDKFVIDRYSFKGNTSTSAADRAADKAAQIQAFTQSGKFTGSKYKGIGMSEFYGGPNAVDEKGKHYTSTIEKILKTQAKSNNSEMIVLNVQTKSGGSDIYRITDQNGNMVATLTDPRQVQTIRLNNPNYNVEAIRVPDMKNTTPSFAIKITEEMLEPYKTHKAKGGLVEMIDIFEVA